MKDLLLAINGLTTNVGGVKTSLAEFRSEMTGFRTEMSGVKADVVRIETHMKTHMVTKENLVEEVRVQIKTQNTSSFNTSEVKSLRKQISKVDPAQKSLRFRGFKEENLAKRAACIEQILKEVGIDKADFVCEHVYQGPHNAKVLNDMCIVALPSNSIRESVLKKVENETFKDPSGNELKIDRAKTEFQRSRNAVLRRVMDVLKKDARCKAEDVKIEWRMPDVKNKDREVQVAGVIAFRQLIDDSSGCFLGSFSDLTV